MEQTITARYRPYVDVTTTFVQMSESYCNAYNFESCNVSGGIRWEVRYL